MRAVLPALPSQWGVVCTLAWRYFRARREQGLVSIVTGFSVAGLGVGVAALILAMAVFTGFRLELRARLYALEAPIKLQSATAERLVWDPSYRELVQNQGEVTAVVPYLNAPSLVFDGAQARGVLFRGLAIEQLQGLPFAAFLIAGDWSPPAEAGLTPAWIGTGLAADLELQVGSEFRAFEAVEIRAADPILPGTRSFQVRGIFDSGIEDVDAALVITPLEAARALIPGQADQEAPLVDGAQIYVRDPLFADRVLGELFVTLEGLPLIPRSSLDFDPIRDGRLGFSAAEHLQLARDQEAALVVILALIILVAAFGVVAGQIMKVREKSREIAVLRSFGAGREHIALVFLLLGLLIGGLGSALGAGIGLILAFNLDAVRQGVEAVSGLTLFPADQFRLAFLPSRPTAGAVSLAVLMALILSVLALVYPALSAARLKPAEALRYE